MTGNADDFLRKVAGYTEAKHQCPVNKLARIDYDYDPATFPAILPKVMFDGENTFSGKGYRCLAPYVPLPGERVLMQPVGNTYVIAGSIDPRFVDDPLEPLSQPATDFIITQNDSSNTDWGDLGSPPLAAPSIDREVRVGAQVSISAFIGTAGGTYPVTGWMSFIVYQQISGSWVEVVPPSENRGLNHVTRVQPHGRYVSASYTTTLTLGAGLFRFLAKYKAQGGGEVPPTATFSHRRIAVVPY